MPTIYQKETFEIILAAFLEATGIACASNNKLKSASATSRFLNVYDWPTRKLIIVFRQWILAQILSYSKKGRKPHLQVILDLTTLEKRGKFEGLNGLIRTYHKKHGLHLVILYLVIGRVRIPWNFRVYRGKNERSQADLGRRLLRSLPKILRKSFKIMVLADSAFRGTTALKRSLYKLHSPQTFLIK